MLKKVIISLLLSLVVVFCLAVSASAAYYGDVDGSGKVNASDARLILRASAQLETLDENQKKIADVNGDNKVNASDARTVLRMSAQIEELVEMPGNSGSDKPSSSLTAIEIHDMASMYTVEVNAQNDEYISTGSGFFTSDDGRVVTNYHVIEGMYEIFITDYNGITYDVVQVLAYDAEMDIAVLKVNAKSTPAVLNYATPRTGAVAYTLGSSKGMTDTFSNGIISNGSRVVPEYHPTMSYIQTTAPISQGNSGGPLINDKAEVIGINSWMRTDGQNLNFAIPVKYINELDYDYPLTMEEFADYFRPGYPEAPDYPDDPDYPDETLNISADTDLRYLDKGGTALVEIEIIGELGDLDLIAEYDTGLFRCEWDENWFVYTDSGNDVAVLYVTPLQYMSTTYIKVYVDGYEDSIYVEIPVSATSDGWYDYGGYPGAVDFGAYTRVAPDYSYMTEEADVVGFYYTITDLYNAGYTEDDIFSSFFDYLESYGYEFYERTDDEYVTVYTFYNEEYDIVYGYSLVYDDYGDVTDILINFTI